VEAKEVFLCFYLFILIFLSRFYLTFLSLFEFPGRELFDCNPELRLARIAPREYAALFAALKRTNFKTKCPQRNNLCNLLAIGISIGDLDCENQDVQ
jgi:hypothetical protein